jgi:hypothetical protein
MPSDTDVTNSMDERRTHSKSSIIRAGAAIAAAAHPVQARPTDRYSGAQRANRWRRMTSLFCLTGALLAERNAPFLKCPAEFEAVVSLVMV